MISKQVIQFYYGRQVGAFFIFFFKKTHDVVSTNQHQSHCAGCQIDGLLTL